MYATVHVYTGQGTGKTRPYLTGHPVHPWFLSSSYWNGARTINFQKDKPCVILLRKPSDHLITLFMHKIKFLKM